ncbi:hypothetical protein CHUAL_013346 [Chamberlinius hualienensis]
MTDVEFCGGVDSTPVLSLGEHQLKYRGEGNGSIVVAIGDTGKILRLIKVADDDESAPSNKSTHGKLLNDDLHWLLRFTSDTVRSLVGRRFIQPGELVVVRACDLSRVNRELQFVRPGEQFILSSSIIILLVFKIITWSIFFAISNSSC